MLWKAVPSGSHARAPVLAKTRETGEMTPLYVTKRDIVLHQVGQ